MVDGQLVRNVIEDGPYGGNGGSAWTDGGEVHLNGHPSAVDVRTGSKLDAIRIKQVAHSLMAETIDELIDTNPKCRLFFKIDLQEYFAALICLSADEFCQPFSWGGNFYVDSGS